MSTLLSMQLKNSLKLFLLNQTFRIIEIPTQTHVTAENLSTRKILKGWRAKGMTAFKDPVM